MGVFFDGFVGFDDVSFLGFVWFGWVRVGELWVLFLAGKSKEIRSLQPFFFFCPDKAPELNLLGSNRSL